MKSNQASMAPFRLAIMYIFIQLIIVLLIPEAGMILSVLVALVSLGVSGYLARVAMRHEGPLRVFWLLLMLALICDGLAQITWASPLGIREDFLYDLSAAEVLWAMEAVLFTIGLVYLFHKEQGLLRGLRFLFDIVIIFIVMITISWEYMLKPQILGMIETSHETKIWLDLAFSVCGMVLIFFTVVLYSNVKQVHRKVAANLCLGGLAFVIGNIYCLITVDILEADPSPYLNLLWTTAVLLIGMAGAHSIPGIRSEREMGERKSVARTILVKYLLPYVVLAGLLFLIIERFGGWGGLFTGLALSVLLILVRQIIIQLENDRLMERLHESLNKSEYLAHHDDLTGLFNRRFFNARLMEGITNANRNGDKLGLLYMDLNQFKSINDSYGHRAGDLLLQMVAQRLNSLDNDRLVFSRIGGDEFTAIVYPVAGNTELAEVADNIFDIISKPYKLEEREICTTSSIGLAIYPDHAADDQELIGRADSAMYAAKEKGLGWQFYSENSTSSPS